MTVPLVVIDHRDESISSTLVGPDVLRQADFAALALRIRDDMSSAVRVRIFGGDGGPYAAVDTDELEH